MHKVNGDCKYSRPARWCPESSHKRYCVCSICDVWIAVPMDAYFAFRKRVWVIILASKQLYGQLAKNQKPHLTPCFENCPVSLWKSEINKRETISFFVFFPVVFLMTYQRWCSRQSRWKSHPTACDSIAESSSGCHQATERSRDHLSGQSRHNQPQGNNIG